MKKPFSERFGDFMAGKGFYIVLFLCVAAIGISGYYLFSSLTPDQDPSTAVGGPAQVTPRGAAGPPCRHRRRPGPHRAHRPPSPRW